MTAPSFPTPAPAPAPVAPSPLPSPPRFAWWSPFVALITAYGVTIVFVGILAGATGNRDGGLPPGMALVGTFFQDGLLIATMVGFATLTVGRVTPATFGLRPVDPKTAIVVSVLAFVVFYVFLVAWSQLQPEARDNLLDDLGAKRSTALLVGVTVLVCLVAPIAEELFFRGFLFPALGSVMHWLPAALLAGAVFGGIHVGGTPVIFLVPLAVFGFLLCVLYHRTGSLLPSMGVHAFNNALTLGVGMGWSVGGVVAVVLIAPAAVLLIVRPLLVR